MPQIPQYFLFVMPDIHIIADALQRPGKGNEKFVNRMGDHLLPVGRIGKAFLLQLLHQLGNECGLFWKQQCVHWDVVPGQFRSQIIYMEPVVQQRFFRVIPMGKAAFVKNAAARRNGPWLSVNQKLHLGHKMQKCVFRIAVGTVDHKAGFFRPVVSDSADFHIHHLSALYTKKKGYVNSYLIKVAAPKHICRTLLIRRM